MQSLPADFSDGKVDPKAAAAKIKEMELHRLKKQALAAHQQPPAAPKVTQAEVESAGLSSRDTRSGLDLPSPLQLFLKYDADKTGGVNRNEFGQMLFDLDSLANVTKKKVRAGGEPGGGGKGVRAGRAQGS